MTEETIFEEAEISEEMTETEGWILTEGPLPDEVRLIITGILAENEGQNTIEEFLVLQPGLSTDIRLQIAIMARLLDVEVHLVAEAGLIQGPPVQDATQGRLLAVPRGLLREDICFLHPQFDLGVVAEVPHLDFPLLNAPPSARRSRSRESRYRPPSRDRIRSPKPPRPDSPRDEGEIREYDTPEREKPPSNHEESTLAPDPEPPQVPEEPKPSDDPPKPSPSPKPPSLSAEAGGDVGMQSPSSVPPEEASTSSLPPNSLPTTPLLPPKPPLRSTSPPKHPRNWPESNTADSPPIFLPNSLRRGRGRNSGSYRGGNPSYRGGTPSEPPRAPRNWGVPQASSAQDHQESASSSAPAPADAPSPTDPTPSKTDAPPPTEPDDTFASLWELIDQELEVTPHDLEERELIEAHKQLRDDFLNAHQRSQQLTKEYHNVIIEQRRAIREYDMSILELRHLQLRRQVSNKQHDLARLGLLGMDFEPDASTSYASATPSGSEVTLT
ncbi:hypothetical protein BT96DRAFT_987333 [Gymnopus androsaceus JB14]|uniref:Uncharacterized protein n=1 Tax=Gymnopus androsaceus JB14 TaxID=1447944 RepID=A0A6A4IBX4_9AGAR|nr:hypothetical protein BT96DRAFT_987333 [Gymnopus androsaceus JB14]